MYAHFARQGWTRQDTDHNVLNKHSSTEVEGSPWDPDLIMHYGFPGGLILQPPQYTNGLQPALGLTEADKAEVRKFYPPLDENQYTTLHPFRLERIQLNAGEQANYIVEPAETREFTIQTFGRADTLMVLFENQDGDHVFVAGDDDSGTSYNAKIQTRLIPNRRYILRLRLFYNWASAETALLMW